MLFLAVALPLSLLLLSPFFDGPEKAAATEKVPSSETSPANNKVAGSNGAAVIESEPNFSEESRHVQPASGAWKTIRFSYDERLNGVSHSLLHYLRGAFLKKHGTLYPYPALPKIAFVAPAELSLKVCHGKCLVRGWFPTGNTLYLDNSLKVLTNLEHRSILLHEIVHYFQYFSHTEHGTQTANTDRCEAWLARETEAYVIQHAWLEEQHAGKKLIPSYQYRRQRLGGCPTTPSKREN